MQRSGLDRFNDNKTVHRCSNVLQYYFNSLQKGAPKSQTLRNRKLSHIFLQTCFFHLAKLETAGANFFGGCENFIASAVMLLFFACFLFIFHVQFQSLCCNVAQLLLLLHPRVEVMVRTINKSYAVTTWLNEPIIDV